MPDAVAGRCPACGAELSGPSRCPSCSAESSPDGLVCLRGSLAHRRQQPADEPAAWHRALTLQLEDGQHVPVEISSERTRELRWPGASDDQRRREGARVAVFGELLVIFGEEHAGPREAPERSLRLRAQLLAIGPGADRLIDRAIAQRGDEPVDGEKTRAALERLPEGIEVIREGTTTRICLPGAEPEERGGGLAVLLVPGVAGMLFSNCYGNSSAGYHVPMALGHVIFAGLLLYTLIALLYRRTVVEITPERLSALVRPLPWFGGWRAASEDVRRVAVPSHEGPEALFVDGETRSLLPAASCNSDAHDFIAAAVNATLDGDGGRVPTGGRREPPVGIGVLRGIILIFCLFAISLSLHLALPLRALIWHGDVVRDAISHAARCGEVVEGIGRGLAWGAGNPGGRQAPSDVRAGHESFSINLVGSGGRAKLSVRYVDRGPHHELLEAKVDLEKGWRGGIDLLTCKPHRF